MKRSIATDARRSVVTVPGARGFVVTGLDGPMVVTAAHCLPFIPPPHLARNLGECTYENFVGPLDKKPTFAVECVFVDTISDIAVLGAPDGQELYEDAERYEAFIEATPPLRLAALTVPDRSRIEAAAWALSLSGNWIEFTVTISRKWVALNKSAKRIKGGMSGSPILLADGSVTGLVSTSGGDTGLSPNVPATLPGWLFDKQGR